MVRLSAHLITGDGFRMDQDEALGWYRKAAGPGSAAAKRGPVFAVRDGASSSTKRRQQSDMASDRRGVRAVRAGLCTATAMLRLPQHTRLKSRWLAGTTREDRGLAFRGEPACAGWLGVDEGCAGRLMGEGSMVE